MSFIDTFFFFFFWLKPRLDHGFEEPLIGKGGICYFFCGVKTLSLLVLQLTR